MESYHMAETRMWTHTMLTLLVSQSFALLFADHFPDAYYGQNT